MLMIRVIHTSLDARTRCLPFHQKIGTGLVLEAYLGAPESYDSVLIDWTPRIHSKIEGGVHGDIATASITVNSIPAVLSAATGLRTMRDVRLPSFAAVR